MMEELMDKLDLLSESCRVLGVHTTNDFILAKSLLQIKDVEIHLDQAKKLIQIRIETDKKRLERMQLACNQISQSSEGHFSSVLPQELLNDVSILDSNSESYSGSDYLKTAEQMRELLYGRGFTPDLETDITQSLRKEVEVLSAARQEATAQLEAYHGLPTSLPEAKAFVDGVKVAKIY